MTFQNVDIDFFPQFAILGTMCTSQGCCSGALFANLRKNVPTANPKQINTHLASLEDIKDLL